MKKIVSARRAGKGRLFSLPRNVVLLGWTSFFTDAGSEMILPILPLFLRGVLKAPMLVIGIIEGVAEATANVLRFFSGLHADRIGKSKPFVIFGYSLSAVVKPLLALVPSWPFVLGVRFLDRVGKGIRSAPRDALVAASTPKRIFGKAYGFHRSMDTAGAVVGSGVAAVALFFIVDVASPGVRWLFAASAVPSLFALVFLGRVKERPRPEPKDAAPGAKRSLSLREVFTLPKTVWLLLAGITFWELGNISYAFVLLRVADLGFSPRVVPAIYFLYNAVYMAVAMPIGMFSDRVGIRTALLLGPLLGAAAFWSLSLSTAWIAAASGMLVFALHSAAVNTVPRVAVAHFAPRSARGTVFGLVGVCALLGNTLVGWLWQTANSVLALRVAGLLSLLALIPFAFLSFRPARISTAGRV